MSIRPAPARPSRRPFAIRGRRSGGLALGLLGSAAGIPAAYAQDAVAAADVTPLATTAVNPNAADWTLINLKPADVTAAAGGAGAKVALLDGPTDCRDTDLAGRCINIRVSGATYTGYSTHGTHTAGIIAGARFGIATGTSVINYGVFDDKGWVANGTLLSTIWRDAYARGASIASMSFGCAKTALCFGGSDIATMAQASVPMLYVKAAGNDGVALGNESTGVNSATITAAMNRVLLVGSVNAAGVISSFSNRPGDGCALAMGSTTCTEGLKWKYHFLVAPGEAIYSTLPNNTYGYMSGTSMATPAVAGAAALLEARWPKLKTTPETVAKILLTSATDLGAPGVDAVYGYGLLNVGAAFMASGSVTLVSTSGVATVVSGSTITTGPALKGLAGALGKVTVYDQYGRDYPLAETGALASRTSILAMRQLLGRRQEGEIESRGWAESFFADVPQRRGYALFGAAGDVAGTMLGIDRSLRMGVDLPLRGGGIAQFRMTGAGDPRLDFARDPGMRPLASFASTALLRGALISNAVIPVRQDARLMVYGIVTTGAVDALHDYDPTEMRLTDSGYMPRSALSATRQERRQSGIGMGYWTRSRDGTVLGVNLSMIEQRGGYYTVSSSLADFNRPTRMLNLGAAASRTAGAWDLSLSGEVSRLNTAGGDAAIRFTTATLVSADLSAGRNGILFAGGKHSDTLRLAISLPPRAVTGNLRVDYMAPTSDGLGQQAASTIVPISKLGAEPVRAELAYRLRSGAAGSRGAWSFGVSGGVNFARVPGLGMGEGMATFRLAY
ncbi:MAG: S8 family serine peptidase [Sphingomonadales bacterium]|nr:S8 family serine peptidase [Sphingomonadales bacterium]